MCINVFIELCWECRESFLFQQQRDLREYTQATIYIRKVIEDKRVCNSQRRIIFICLVFNTLHTALCVDDKRCST